MFSCWKKTISVVKFYNKIEIVSYHVFFSFAFLMIATPSETNKSLTSGQKCPQKILKRNYQTNSCPHKIYEEISLCVSSTTKGICFQMDSFRYLINCANPINFFPISVFTKNLRLWLLHLIRYICIQSSCYFVIVKEPFQL